MLDAPATMPKRQRGFAEGHTQVAELLPLAVRLGVPVPAGTDVTGSIPWEVALLAQMGLDPEDALAAASTWPRRFLGAPATANIVTYLARTPASWPVQPPSWSAESGCEDARLR